MAENKTIDERCVLSRRKGDGQLRREVWTDETGRIVRYNLAYINHTIFAGDNGRVVGYDNNHGVHHRHYMGQITPVAFSSIEVLEAQFHQDWSTFMQKQQGQKRS